jgi:hypothetical protein
MGAEKDEANNRGQEIEAVQDETVHHAAERGQVATDK